MKAYCLIRDQPWYRREAFIKGLRAAGHTLHGSLPKSVSTDDVLVIWNRYGPNHDLARSFEAAGGSVLIVENGYVGAGGGTPKFQVHPQGPKPDHYYAIARNFHNGGGTWHVGDVDRFAMLNLNPKPWRMTGDYVLVAPNRSFGVPGRMMSPDWADRCAEKLRSKGIKVKLRLHPGSNQPKISLERDLAGAAAVVIWTSSVGVHALLEGIPVVCESQSWICKQATVDSIDKLDRARDYAARDLAMRNMAWAQWTCEEIERGEPFRHLLPAAG